MKKFWSGEETRRNGDELFRVKVVGSNPAGPTINITVKDVCQFLPQDNLPNLNVAVNKRDPKTIHIVPKKFLGERKLVQSQQSSKGHA